MRDALLFVTWNCADHFERKAEKLLSLRPDIVVVSEVRKEHAGSMGDEYVSLWFGEEGQRGILIAAKNPITVIPRHQSGDAYCVLVDVEFASETLNLVGIWSVRKQKSYVRTVCDGLSGILPRLNPHNQTIVGGDFNASSVFDKGGSASESFSQIDNILTSAGLQSLWHAQESEQFGEETQPTYFHQWNRDRPFHIDYVYVSDGMRARLEGLEIGTFDKWRPDGSDHMPILCNFVPRD
jgi:endonuclease/exonuclease/phosphatase family metal-dependent hydrolase